MIIPTYNRPGFLHQTVASVLSQTFTDFEIIIIDDGSIEDYHPVLAGIQDERIHYHYQQNAGLAAARNAGIRQARGELVAFLDDDDLWLPEKLARQVQVFIDQPEVGLVTTGHQVIDGQGNLLSEVRPWLYRPVLDLPTWLVACPTVPSAVMVRRGWLETAGCFDEEISRQACGAEDWDLWLRLAYAGCPMAWLQEITCAYRVQAGSMVQHAGRQRASMLFVLDKLFERAGLPEWLTAEKDRIYSQAYLRAAARLYIAGQGQQAGNDLERAVILDPALLERSAELVFNALIGWIGDPLVGDPLQYIEQIFNNLPPAVSTLDHRRRQAIHLARRQALLRSCQDAERGACLKSLGCYLLSDPSLLSDRQVLSISVETLIGSDGKRRLGRLLGMSRTS